MAKEKDVPPADNSGTTDKLQAFTQTISAVGGLSRPDRLDVLRAVAQFYGLVIPMEIPR